jgi:hypothetical protein
VTYYLLAFIQSPADVHQEGSILMAKIMQFEALHWINSALGA